MLINTKQKVRELLALAKVKKPPIPVEKIAKLHQIKIKFSAFEGDISGLLYKKNKRAVIGINGFHPPVRQRFTLAHELGHFFMGHTGDFFLDREVFFRNSDSSDGTIETERAANKFAAELLMPEEMLRKALRNRPIEQSDEDSIRELAEKFMVSVQAMTIRLQNLGLILF